SHSCLRTHYRSASPQAIWARLSFHFFRIPFMLSYPLPTDLQVRKLSVHLLSFLGSHSCIRMHYRLLSLSISFLDLQVHKLSAYLLNFLGSDTCILECAFVKFFRFPFIPSIQYMLSIPFMHSSALPSIVFVYFLPS
ncbi:hypothetical protein L9F63_024950, partial [Diploptera punctata]